MVVCLLVCRYETALYSVTARKTKLHCLADNGCTELQWIN